MTRNELERFIRYLRQKSDVVIDPYFSRSQFNPKVDRTELVRLLVKQIQDADSERDAYKALAMHLLIGMENSEHDLFDSICFREDLHEHLLENGFSAEDATELTAIVASGRYKAHRKQNPKDDRLTGDLAVFATACKRLPHRAKITELLPTEYAAFLQL